MISLTTDQLERLKDNYIAGRTAAYLIKKRINGDWLYITDRDTPIQYGGATYQPGYIDDQSVSDIEITSEPKTNDLDIDLDANENSFVAYFLNSGWANGPVTVYEQHWDDEGAILTKNVFEGLIDDFSMDEKSRKITEKVASVWADFEKQAGTRTNSKSQQRFYPNDTGFDHVARAKRKIYWGKKTPSPAMSGGGSPSWPPPQQEK